MCIPDEKGHDIFKYFIFLISKGIFNVFKSHSISINFILKMNLDLLEHPYYILIGQNYTYIGLNLSVPAVLA